MKLHAPLQALMISLCPNAHSHIDLQSKRSVVWYAPSLRSLHPDFYLLAGDVGSEHQSRSASVAFIQTLAAMIIMETITCRDFSICKCKPKHVGAIQTKYSSNIPHVTLSRQPGKVVSLRNSHLTQLNDLFFFNILISLFFKEVAFDRSGRSVKSPGRWCI